MLGMIMLRPCTVLKDGDDGCVHRVEFREPRGRHGDDNAMGFVLPNRLRGHAPMPHEKHH